ncbi:hypothetical protein TWF703_007090 [Orbilia oligospora]|uniref:Uncharacterized protein n=1 Tax=Orbilia oligospora TaxID=2813651 RepID=A0A7C8JQZ5_ORBOL|nr:hypothetical protein TWF703_007090 [Orbilia oligospora]
MYASPGNIVKIAYLKRPIQRIFGFMASTRKELKTWIQLASKGSSVYGEPELDSSNSPENATIVSLTCKSLAPCATFTLTPSCIKEVAKLPASGAQNQSPVPATECREDCNIWRRLTGTCCGVGGSMCNPVVVPSGAELPFTVPLTLVTTTTTTTTTTYGFPYQELQRIQKRDRVFGTKWKACDFSTQPGFPWAVTGDYHAVYNCKGSADYLPNICGNLRSAIEARGQPSIVTRITHARGLSGSRTTEDWYSARPENAGAALGETGGWRIAGCNIEEYPFWSVNALPAPARDHPVLWLVEQTVPSKPENSQHASDWDQFLVADADTPGEHDGNWGLEDRGKNICGIPFGTDFLVVEPYPPGHTNEPYNDPYLTRAGNTDSTLQFCDWPSPGTLSIRQGILLQSREITYAAAQGPPGGTIPPYPPSVNWAWEQTTFVGDGGTTTMLKGVPMSCRPWPLASLVVPSEPATYRIPSNMNDLPVWPNLATRDLGAKRNVDPEHGVFGPNEGPNETMSPIPKMYCGQPTEKPYKSDVAVLVEGLCDNLGVCAQTYWRGQDWTKTPPSTGDIAGACETESQQTWETPGTTDGLFPDSLSGVRHYGQICSYKGKGNQQLEPGLEVGTLTCGRFNAKCTALRPREEQICFWGQILALATCVWV